MYTLQCAICAVIVFFGLPPFRASPSELKPMQTALHNSTDEAPMNEAPLSVIDRNIDALGDEHRIRSEKDAEAYVNALLEKFKINDALLTGLSEFKAKLVRSEFSAVVHPENRISEAMVGQVFNDTMDEMQMPQWTRISPKELHAFRVTMSLALYPKSVTRLDDGNLPQSCRPVEALYLMYLLHSNMGVRPELRDAIKTGRWPTNDPQTLSANTVTVRLGMSSTVDGQRLREYRTTLSTYLAAHPSYQFQNLVEKLFAHFRIE